MNSSQIRVRSETTLLVALAAKSESGPPLNQATEERGNHECLDAQRYRIVNASRKHVVVLVAGTPSDTVTSIVASRCEGPGFGPQLGLGFARICGTRLSTSGSPIYNYDLETRRIPKKLAIFTPSTEGQVSWCALPSRFYRLFAFYPALFRAAAAQRRKSDPILWHKSDGILKTFFFCGYFRRHRGPWSGNQRTTDRLHGHFHRRHTSRSTQV